ncbi:MAG: DUF1634 domain-containing protein, partial [Nitrososphaerales archaeon]
MGDEGSVEAKSRQMQLVISKTLAYGVITATAIVLFGVALMIVEGATGYQCNLSSLPCLLSYNATTVPHGDYPNSISALIAGVAQLKPFAIIELGVIVLLATPVARVGTSTLVFAVEKDKAFVLITLGVLLILLF